MIYYLKRAALISIALIASNVLASPSYYNNQVTTNLKNAYEGGYLDLAYDIASSHAFVLEGDPDFDFYYGLTALSLKKYPEAQFCFERLVMIYPEQPRYRLEYGRTLFHLKDYDEAAKQFQWVLSTNPPDTVRENINVFLKAIKRAENKSRNFFSGGVGIGSGYDSNINSATDLETLGSIVLSETSQSTDSSYITANTNINFGVHIGSNMGFIFGFDSQHRYNEVMSDFDYDTGRLKASLKANIGRNQFQLGTSYLNILLDGEAYQTALGLSLQWQRRWNNSLAMLASAGLTAKEYDENPELDSDQPSFSLTFVSASKSDQHALTFSLSTDQAVNEGNDHQMKDTTVLGYQFSKALSGRTSLYMGGSFSTNDYQGVNPIFGDVRSDTSLQMILGSKWRVSKSLMFQLEGAQIESDSNLEIYDYSRTRADIKLNWLF